MQYVLLQRRSRWRSTSITSPVVVIETATIEKQITTSAGSITSHTATATRCLRHVMQQNSKKRTAS